MRMYAALDTHTVGSARRTGRAAGGRLRRSIQWKKCVQLDVGRLLGCVLVRRDIQRAPLMEAENVDVFSSCFRQFGNGQKANFLNEDCGSVRNGFELLEIEACP